MKKLIFSIAAGSLLFATSCRDAAKNTEEAAT